MVQFYKLLKKTITIIAIINKTKPASPTPATTTKGVFWKDHTTPKFDKQL
jgi:hypothetical protein